MLSLEVSVPFGTSGVGHESPQLVYTSIPYLCHVVKVGGGRRPHADLLRVAPVCDGGDLLRVGRVCLSAWAGHAGLDMGMPPLSQMGQEGHGGSG